MPRSKPILKRMNTSISSPTIVVTELPVIEQSIESASCKMAEMLAVTSDVSPRMIFVP